jgi:hypothetical protein
MGERCACTVLYYVSRVVCSVREVGYYRWAAMKVRLDKWKSNVKGVLDALQKSGATAASVDGQ